MLKDWQKEVFMENLSTSCLNKHQLNDIKNLEQICNCSVYYETGEHDNNCFFLLYKDDLLIAYGGILITDNSELSIMFHPDYRNDDQYDDFMNYIFDELWEQDILEIYITGHRDQTWFSDLMDECEAVYSHSEYLMELTELIDIPVVQINDYKIVREDSNDYTIYTIFIGKKEAGHCNITVSGDLVNIWGVFISPPLRDKGVGRLLIKNIITSLLSEPDNDKKIILQVSSNNIPALKVYKACGFTIQDSVDYFNVTL